MDGTIKILMVALAIFVLAFPIANALSIDITPAPGSNKLISNQNCGSTFTGLASQILIKNNGKGGVLCWYYTSQSQSGKLTPKCIAPADSQSNPVTLNMPLSGEADVNVQLVCYDFFNGTDDTCNDGYSQQQASDNRLTCANADGTDCSGQRIDEIAFNLSCSTLDFGVTPSNDILYLYNGQSYQDKINITNPMNESLYCDHNIGLVPGNSSVFSHSVGITAPLTGSGAYVQTEDITCLWQGGTSATKTAAITVHYKPDPCVGGVADANNALLDARNKLTEARQAIQSHGNSDVSQEQQTADSALADISSGQDSLNLAQSTCNAGLAAGVDVNTQAAITKANQALQLADNVINLLTASNSSGQGEASNSTVTGNQGAGSQGAGGGQGVTEINISGYQSTGLDPMLEAGIVLALIGILIWFVLGRK